MNKKDNHNSDDFVFDYNNTEELKEAFKRTENHEASPIDKLRERYEQAKEDEDIKENIEPPIKVNSVTKKIKSGSYGYYIPNQIIVEDILVSQPRDIVQRFAEAEPLDPDEENNAPASTIIPSNAVLKPDSDAADFAGGETVVKDESENWERIIPDRPSYSSYNTHTKVIYEAAPEVDEDTQQSENTVNKKRGLFKRKK